MVGAMFLVCQGRQLFFSPVVSMERRGRGSLGSGGLSFSCWTSSSQGSNFLKSYSSISLKEKALKGEISALVEKGALELPP